MNNGERLTKLYLRNLPVEFDSEDLEKLLARFEPTEIRVPKDQLGASKCMAFVRVPSRLAQIAVDYLDRRRVEDRVIKVAIADRQ